jgi:hypothetical protein
VINRPTDVNRPLPEKEPDAPDLDPLRPDVHPAPPPTDPASGII